MARSMRLFSSAFIVILLLVAIEMAPKVAEADKDCEKASGKFKGICLSDSNCASVCKSEGYTGGKCRGLKMKCHCKKPGNCN